MTGASRTLLSAVPVAAQSTPIPQQATQLPPPGPPVPAPVTPATTADTRPYVALVTDLGTITLRIEEKRAPVTAPNFLRYRHATRLDGFKFYPSTKSWGPGDQLIHGGNRGQHRLHSRDTSVVV